MCPGPNAFDQGYSHIHVAHEQISRLNGIERTGVREEDEVGNPLFMAYPDSQFN
jgi:hypothetical protein